MQEDELIAEIENCLDCGCPIEAGQVYCEACWQRLEAEGFFEL